MLPYLLEYLLSLIYTTTGSLLDLASRMLEASLHCIWTGTGAGTGTLLNVHTVTIFINICRNLVMLHSISQYLYIQYVALRHWRQACMPLTIHLTYTEPPPAAEGRNRCGNSCELTLLQ